MKVCSFVYLTYLRCFHSALIFSLSLLQRRRSWWCVLPHRPKWGPKTTLYHDIRLSGAIQKTGNWYQDARTRSCICAKGCKLPLYIPVRRLFEICGYVGVMHSQYITVHSFCCELLVRLILNLIIWFQIIFFFV